MNEVDENCKINGWISESQGSVFSSWKLWFTNFPKKLLLFSWHLLEKQPFLFFLYQGTQWCENLIVLPLILCNPFSIQNMVSFRGKIKNKLRGSLLNAGPMFSVASYLNVPSHSDLSCSFDSCTAPMKLNANLRNNSSSSDQVTF